MKANLQLPDHFLKLNWTAAMDGKDLKDLLDKVLLEDREGDFQEFMAQFDYTHCLVDGDGYSIDLLYSNKHMAVYYYHRQKNEAYISILGIVDWKIEMMRFLAGINQFFAHDLSPFEPRMILETDRLIHEFGIE